ncbi:MAG: LysM peptidoglycan-binding domain-containing protein [Ruminococcaceae bacterium]|nr:LysM peptidoglycan-binding domain-containing protein [Oscillospiraceae bacterium]
MNKYEKQGARIQAPIGEKVIMTEMTEEFSLPDYQPEMKRLLRVSATVMPADSYVGAGSAECAGAVDYTILYAGNDGLIYCANQSGEYRFSTPVEIGVELEAGEGILCDVEPLVEQVTGRVVAPRRLLVKCKLKGTVKLYGQRLIGDALEGEDSVERLCGESESAVLFLGMGEELALADEILCDGETADMRVICGEGRVFVTDAVAGSGCVNCRGELVLKLLGAKGDGAGGEKPVRLIRRIPFSQSVPVDGAEVNCEACADGVCRTLQVTVEEGRILCDATVCLQARAVRNQRVSYVRDAYSTVRSCETVYKKLKLPYVIRALNGNLSLNTAMPLEEAGVRPGAEAVDVTGWATVESPEVERGKYRIGGKCRFHVILSDGEEFHSREIEIPFRFETEGGRELPAMWDLRAEVISCRVRLDGERLGVDAELAIMACLRGEREIEMLTEASFGGEWKQEEAVCRICYPERGDTLWSVAKRYHCGVNDLSERNRLANAPAADAVESLAGVNYLMIS